MTKFNPAHLAVITEQPLLYKKSSLLMFIISIFAFIFLMTGCSSPQITEEEKVFAPITQTQKNESSLRKRRQVDWTVFYEGTIAISGKYVLLSSYNPYGNYLNGALCFYVDEAMGHLIPRGQQVLGDNIYEDTRPPWFCFSNKEEAIKEFFSTYSRPKCNYGTATIEISNYIARLKGVEAYDTALLEKVISKRIGAGC